ncbi:PP2C family protein-serine/threonine phosphatase [Profundibacter amoris]|uniref:Fused response regulator/phosphatase n=1 Tax=Profundibacter amoris TaxID=2171755 RepID=A0A347UM23_9RHOB|nr:SpoIIE family protein phosphatase [Profundibacter amoris]AXX99901.1 fused response regulator/phosphatase [Profundibacter amoris]
MQQFEADLEQDEAIKRVLVVDDSRVQRRILSSSLKRWGYEVLEADSGHAALEICKREQLDLVLSDWMMPGMNGLEFCIAFRELEQDNYGYFILLTSKSEKDEVAHGLDVGADDFLTKPVNASELRARIRAGERLQKMQRELTEKNRLVTDALAEIQCLYDIIDRDLIEAKKLQQSLVKERYRNFGRAEVSLLLRSSGHVGGDLVGFFPVSETQIGLYSIDVSGHGITSALMTARLAGFLSGSTPDQNLALRQDNSGGYTARSPAAVTEHLNRIVLEEMETEHYFTLLLAHIDLTTGVVTATQAGHPHPAIQRANGTVEFCGTGGLPVGLIPGAEFEDFQVKLNAGDRLLLMSDGITECPDETGAMLEEKGVADLLNRNVKVRGNGFLEALMWDLTNYAGDQDFPDDISAVLLEFNGP